MDISTGFICNLAKQFSECTEEERNQIFKDLITAPILHSDFTFGRVAGKQGAVIITATDDGKVLYQGRSKKGDEGVKDSPVEHYNGIHVSDHEAALIKHGNQHQECLGHIRRYARKFKRKAHQVMSFRSQKGLDRFCDGLSVIESIKAEGGSVFNGIAARFNKRRAADQEQQ